MLTSSGFSKKLILSSAAASAALSSPLAVGAYANPQTLTPKKVKIDTTQMLRIGSQGRAVEQLQIKLKQKNYYDDSIDGIYGVHTRSAVTLYQQSAGLRVDGVAGPRTLSTLFSVEGNFVMSEKTLSIGDRGQAVRAVQSELQALGYYTYKVDGIYGPITKDAVKHFQAVNGLKIDGIVGPQTRGMLFHTDAKGQSVAQVAAVHIASNGQGLVADARQLIGTPYQWGGTTPSGFDCSGFINYVFEKNGINVPRTVSQLWNQTISIDNPRAGDLVFFETTRPGPSHAGIYIGNGRFVHVGSDGVTIDSIDNPYYWQPRYLGAKRVVQN